jgi:hypothetical protein
MKTNISVVRIVAAVLGTGVVAVFVHVYSLLQANWLQYGHKLSLTVLPLPTMFYHRYALAGYVLPIVAALLLVPKGAETAERSARLEVPLKVLGLAALVWVLGCVLAWQLPCYSPTALIE